MELVRLYDLRLWPQVNQIISYLTEFRRIINIISPNMSSFSALHAAPVVGNEKVICVRWTQCLDIRKPQTRPYSTYFQLLDQAQHLTAATDASSTILDAKVCLPLKLLPVAPIQKQCGSLSLEHCTSKKGTPHLCTVFKVYTAVHCPFHLVV